MVRGIVQESFSVYPRFRTAEGVLSFSVQSNDPRCEGDLCNIEKICSHFTDPKRPA